MAVSPPEGLVQLANTMDDHYSALTDARAQHRYVSGKAHFAAADSVNESECHTAYTLTQHEPLLGFEPVVNPKETVKF